MLDKLIQLKSSVSYEIASHFKLLSVDRESLLKYFSSPYRIILIIIFAVLFFPHVFAVVNDLNFIIAYEVDPGSIMKAILSLYQHSYNMNESFHSRYYGWTYYAINYVLLMPIYLAKVFRFFTADYYIFVAIRFIFFMIGLASVLAFFQVAKRTLNHTFLSFTATLLYIASPTIYRFFYLVHPESTGLLFSFLGVLCLLKFNEGKAENYRWYTFGLLSLVLSALSKHFFLVTALPVLFLFYYLYCYHHHLSILKFTFSRRFAKILSLSVLFSILIFFIVNPFAFIQAKVFIGNQMSFFSGNTQSQQITSMEAIRRWFEQIKTVHIMYISILVFPITLLGAIVLGRDQKVGRLFYLVNLIGCLLYVVLVSLSMKYIINVTYFSHIYPFFVLNFLSIPLYIVRKWNVNIIKLLVMIPLAYFLFFVLVADFSVTIPIGFTRLMYKDTIAFKVFSYIEDKIPPGSKVANDHLVGLPSDKNLIDCDYWASACGTDYIEEFQPDYVIFSENWKFNGQTLPGTLRLKKYVSDHGFILIDTISSKGVYYTISIWKKPD
jgi:hypothetical protein